MLDRVGVTTLPLLNLHVGYQRSFLAVQLGTFVLPTEQRVPRSERGRGRVHNAGATQIVSAGLLKPEQGAVFHFSLCFSF